MEDRKLVSFMLGIQEDEDLNKLTALLDRSKASMMREAVKAYVREHVTYTEAKK